jgi:3-methyladenine DNA glycosylase AlkD
VRPSALLRALRARLRAAGDPDRAAGAQRYMKSAMPFRGIPAPEQRRIFRDVFAHVDFESAASWRAAALGLWRGARYREERYGAMALTGVRRFERFQDMRALPMYEEMITSGAWWDYVDHLAAHRLGLLLRLHRREMGRRLRTWSRGDDMWKRRSAILCQLTFRADTDLALLYDCIEPSLPSREFFLRKAIGWALRAHAWTDPAEVTRYVARMGDRLSPLSRREALKNVGPAGRRRSRG